MDQTSTNAASAAPHQSFAALRQAGSRPYLLFTMLAMTGDSIEHVVSYWIMFQKFQSHALAGFAVISHWVPFLIFSVYAGALADKFDPRRIIQWGMVLFMIASLGWGVLFLTDRLEMWHAMVLLVIHGLAGVLWGPASQMLIQEIVPPAQLQSGVRLIATARTLGILLGPAVGGAIMLVIGPSYTVLLNTLVYLPLIVWLWRAPYGPKFRAGPPVKRAAIRGLHDIIATARAISGNRTIVAMTVLAGAASFFVGNAFQPLIPAFAADLGFARSEVYYSLLLGANAAGAVAAGIGLELRGALTARPRTAMMLAIAWCVAIGGFALSTSYALALVLLFCAGFLHLAYSAMTQTLVQLEAPAEIRGRVIGLYSTSAHGLISFSGVTVGFGASLVGIHWSLALSAAALLIVAAALLLASPRAKFSPR